MRIDAFDFHLPEARIAQRPLDERDASRLMVLPRAAGAPAHRRFRDLPGLLRPGDLLVVNDVRVIPARLRGRKADSGGRVEALLVAPVGDRDWRAMAGASKPIRVGMRLLFAGAEAEVVADEGGGFVRLRFDLAPGDLLAHLEGGAGELPLPPYIGTAPGDDALHRQRYQTVFAARPGAVAAPTAGLHFTDRILADLEAAGIARAAITLHVGPGTFLPVRAERAEDHVMHAERFEVPEATCRAVEACRKRGGRVVAVGTTVLRTLEAAADGEGRLVAGEGETDLFVRPGYRFRMVDGLLTNFHLPRSTLLMLVCALAGRERVLDAYEEAVAREYRFYSYGDAMLLL
jgi:S-adenosylmethionine:tRNA ribosyltransferase-isomerase